MASTEYALLSASVCQEANNESIFSKSKLKTRKDIVCQDLSQQSLIGFSLDVISEPSYLQFLYLQGNMIEKLPHDFFHVLPALIHLDLRQNRLLEIPTSISGHSNLEVLLLQDNQLTCLPCELGQVPRLRKLQFSGNPLKWPATPVLSQGLTAILSHLREAFMEKLCTEFSDGKSQLDNCGDKFTEDTTEVLSKAPQASDLSSITCQTLQSSDLSEIEDCTSSPGMLRSYGEEKLCLRVEEQRNKIKHITGNYLKRNLKLINHEGRSYMSNTATRNWKCLLFKPNISQHHAQVVLNGRTFPLGYKKRCSGPSTSKVCKTLFKQLWLNQLKNVLQSQDHALQKEKSSEALKRWREEAKALQKSNCQLNWSGLDVPYDIDSQYLKIATRTRFQKNESLEKKGHSKPTATCVKVLGLQEKIDQILRSFDDLRSNKDSSHSDTSYTDPTRRRKQLADEIKKIRNLQKAVQALRISA